MNERIKLLAEQTHVYAGGHSIFCHESDIKKFAELIVKECAIIANRADNTETEIRCMYDVITEHFGVEE
jgi:hypothetical protein